MKQRLQKFNYYNRSHKKKLNILKYVKLSKHLFKTGLSVYTLINSFYFKFFNK